MSRCTRWRWRPSAVRDAGVRAVRTSGAAVAHQPPAPHRDRLQRRPRVRRGACRGPRAARAGRARRRSPRERRTSRAASARSSSAMTLDRAGTRILEVLDQGAGRRRDPGERRPVRHARRRPRPHPGAARGGPADVRRARAADVAQGRRRRSTSWPSSSCARRGDEVNASSDELALIPFPVDELFSVHLSSFDAVVLRDFDAAPYGLTKHLPALAHYVDKGGGLIMVGRPERLRAGQLRAHAARPRPAGGSRHRPRARGGPRRRSCRASPRRGARRRCSRRCSR